MSDVIRLARNAVIERRRQPVIQWAVLVTVLLHLIATIYGYGRLTQAVEDHTARLERVERQIDTLMGGVHERKR